MKRTMKKGGGGSQWKGARSRKEEPRVERGRGGGSQWKIVVREERSREGRGMAGGEGGRGNEEGQEGTGGREEVSTYAIKYTFSYGGTVAHVATCTAETKIKFKGRLCYFAGSRL